MPVDLVIRYHDFVRLWASFHGLPRTIIGPAEMVILEQLADGPKALSELNMLMGRHWDLVEESLKLLADHSLVPLPTRSYGPSTVRTDGTGRLFSHGTM